MPDADHPAIVRALLAVDPVRRAALAAVAALALPDGWIGAGFVRDAVWDRLHGYGTRPPAGDVDVVWHDTGRPSEAHDRAVERGLAARLPGLRWSVKNQARMHRRNGDAPYASVADAMRRWPETATAVAVRWDGDGGVAINAPFGTDDLFGLRLRPTPAFAGDRRGIFDRRVAAKAWLARYPLLRMAAAGG